MNCQRNVNFILPTQLPHEFPYIVAILIPNRFESPNIKITIVMSILFMTFVDRSTWPLQNSKANNNFLEFAFIIRR
jgi:hypothetical protein